MPLLFHWPDGTNDRGQCHDMVHFVDWLPTLASACDIDLKQALPLDGRNMLPILRGDNDHPGPTRFWQWSRYQPVPTHNAAMRKGPWKLVMPGVEPANVFDSDDAREASRISSEPEKWVDRSLPEAKGRPEVLEADVPDPQLFNIESDPLETINRAPEAPQRTRRMKSELENWFKDVWQSGRDD